jgi:hypothetical protein
MNSLYCTCPVCNERILSREQLLSLTQEERRRDRRHGPNLGKLWDENETFREDIVELSKISREIGPVEKEYNVEMKKLKQEFTDSTRLAVETIRQQKQLFIKKAMLVGCRGKYKRLIGRYGSKFNRICGTYDIGYWELRNLRRARAKIPKFRERFGYSYRRADNLFYFFRVRI